MEIRKEVIMDVYEYAKENKLLKSSAIRDREFREIFKKVKIKTVVEIGTYKGISAAYIKQFCSKIFTFDIKDYPQKYEVWKDLGIKDRIYFYLIKNRNDIKKVLDTIKFDFAFIDGKHNYKDTKADFKLVKHCGKVLLHDVDIKFDKIFPGVRKFAEEIGAKIIGNNAYWPG